MGNQFNKQILEAPDQLDIQTSNKHCLDQIDLNTLGELPEGICKNIQELKPYPQQMQRIQSQYPKFQSYSSNKFYRGDLNQQKKPHGFGQLVNEDGSTYIGRFVQGKAQPEGIYLTNDGAYYKGQLKKNKAQGKGIFSKSRFLYEGQFSDNLFDGQGVLRVGKRYQFDGIFEKGKKKKGVLTWYQDDEDDQKSVYEGDFNQNEEFTGEGVLRNKFGKYVGNFHNGYKQGQGTFQYETGLTFYGKYVSGIKHGTGIIYNIDRNKDKQITHSRRQDLIAYQGQFFRGMPHGKGGVYDKDLKKVVQTEWNNGVNIQMLQS